MNRAGRTQAPDLSPGVGPDGGRRGEPAAASAKDAGEFLEKRKEEPMVRVSFFPALAAGWVLSGVMATAAQGPDSVPAARSKPAPTSDVAAPATDAPRLAEAAGPPALAGSAARPAADSPPPPARPGAPALANRARMPAPPPGTGEASVDAPPQRSRQAGPPAVAPSPRADSARGEPALCPESAPAAAPNREAPSESPGGGAPVRRPLGPPLKRGTAGYSSSSGGVAG
jgi:hypothetical protein